MSKIKLTFFVLLIFPLQVSLAKTQLKFSAIEGSLNSKICKLVLEEAYAQLDIKVEIIPLPGERALRTSNAGKVDGELFRIANIQKRYQNLVVVPTPINVLQGIAFSKKFHPPIQGWESLKPYNLAIQVGIKFAERGTQGMNPILVDSNEQLFKMLDSERIEIIVAAYANGLKTLKKLKLDSIQALQPPIQEFPLYHYLHKKHAAFVPQIDDVLKGMQQSGRIHEIRKKVLESGIY
jgi:polar amino acid transport system substrate-binding protein